MMRALIKIALCIPIILIIWFAWTYGVAGFNQITALFGSTVKKEVIKPIPPSQDNRTRCNSIGGEPDRVCTPGAIDTDVTQENIKSTICVSGYTKKIRPPVSVTNKIKEQSMKDYGISDPMSNYEEDHLISLELGGAASDTSNLWPEPYAGMYGARIKDRVENYLHSQVCSGKMSLHLAQVGIATDWEQFIPSISSSNISPQEP